jgi:hypothetical protein
VIPGTPVVIVEVQAEGTIKLGLDNRRRLLNFQHS